MDAGKRPENPYRQLQTDPSSSAGMLTDSSSDSLDRYVYPEAVVLPDVQRGYTFTGMLCVCMYSGGCVRVKSSMREGSLSEKLIRLFFFFFRCPSPWLPESSFLLEMSVAAVDYSRGRAWFSVCLPLHALQVLGQASLTLVMRGMPGGSSLFGSRSVSLASHPPFPSSATERSSLHVNPISLTAGSSSQAVASSSPPTPAPLPPFFFLLSLSLSPPPPPP